MLSTPLKSFIKVVPLQTFAQCFSNLNNKYIVLSVVLQIISYIKKMKYKTIYRNHVGFDLGSQILFTMTITITVNVHPEVY